MFYVAMISVVYGLLHFFIIALIAPRFKLEFVYPLFYSIIFFMAASIIESRWKNTVISYAVLIILVVGNLILAIEMFSRM
jgi:hypothetical protein